MFPDEYAFRATIVEYLIDFFQPDVRHLLKNNSPEIRDSMIGYNRSFLLGGLGTPSVLRTMCEEKNIHYEGVVEIILRNLFPEPNDIEWWI